MNSEDNLLKKIEITNKIKLIEKDIKEMMNNKNAEIIKEHFKGISNTDGGLNPIKIWKLKKKIMPKHYNPPMAKIDQDGTLVTNPSSLKKLYLETYIRRLSPNNVK